MSTGTDAPTAPEKKKRKQDKSNRERDTTRDSRQKANDFSAMLLGTPQPERAGGEVTSKSGKSPKKRQREESNRNEASAAAAGTEREESPKKRRKDAHVQSNWAPAVGRIEPPNGYPSQDLPGARRQKLQLASAPAQRNFAGQSVSPIHKSQQAETSNRTSYDRSSPSRARDVAVPGLPAELESPFVSVKASFKVTVPPVIQLYALEGALAHYISPLLLTWHPQLDGILLAYNAAKLHTTPPRGRDGKVVEDQPMARAVDECAAPYVWLTLDALVFKPKIGLEMEGYLNLQNESHISLILWNFFTVTISQRRLPKGWVWHDYYEENTGTSDPEDKPMRRTTEQWGAWYDGQGNEIQGSLRFRIKDWDCAPPGSDGEGSFLSIEGSMLTEEEEEALRKELSEEARQRREMSNAPRGRTPLPSALRRSSTPAQGIPNGSSPAQTQAPTKGRGAKKSTTS